MPEVYLDGKKVRVVAAQAIGKGGEADIYKVGTSALKLYKPPSHPDYKGLPNEQRAAKERIAVHQKKLPAFPKGLPLGVVGPEKLATDATGKKIVGYTMPLVGGEELIRYSDRTFRTGVPNDVIVAVFLDLWNTVQGIHLERVVIGDFNDLNIKVELNTARIIDTDSFQYGQWPCRVFTARFTDPLRCDPSGQSLMLTQPHNEESDWYAFSVMLMQSLLYVDPYGGVYRPADPNDRMPHSERPLRRITVFNPEVKYPKPAVPYDRLSDDLLEHFQLTFEKDQRGVFPVNLLHNLRWTTCVNCGTLHARSSCPACATSPATKPRETVTIRGTVTATRIFQTDGVILFAAQGRNRLNWLYQTGPPSHWLRREDDALVATAQHDPQLRYRISGRRTLLAKNDRLVVFEPSKDPRTIAVDHYNALPLVAANADNYFWIDQGQMFRDDKYGNHFVADVLQDQTLFWVGDKLGFGFYRAGELTRAFLFDPRGSQRGLNDIKLPAIRGQLIDAIAFLGSRVVWFFTVTQEGAERVNRCQVLVDGEIVSSDAAEAGDGTWLGNNIRGKLVAGDALLSATDDGIVRIRLRTLDLDARFPDTEPFVSAQTHLFRADNGLFAVNPQDIYRLRIAASTTT